MKSVLILGLPFYTAKYKYVVSAYQSANVKVRILLNSASESQSGSDTEKVIKYSSSNTFVRLYYMLKELVIFRPRNVDIYDYSILSIVYVIISKVFGKNVRFWLIGWELVGDTQNLNNNSTILLNIIKLKKNLTWLSLQLVDEIYAKENHHVELIKKKRPKLLNKVTQLINGVPISEYSAPNYLVNKKDFLFANAVIPKRNVKELLDAFNSLHKKNYAFKAEIIGFNSISNEVYSTRGASYSKELLEYYNLLNLHEVVQVNGFKKNLSEIMNDFKFFVLPADIILANYALLEAMALGLVPIVYAGDGYDLIVRHGENGFVANNLSSDLEEVLKSALAMNNKTYERMSLAAYETIKKSFSLEIWTGKLVNNLK